MTAVRDRKCQSRLLLQTARVRQPSAVAENSSFAFCVPRRIRACVRLRWIFEQREKSVCLPSLPIAVSGWPFHGCKQAHHVYSNWLRICTSVGRQTENSRRLGSREAKQFTFTGQVGVAYGLPWGCGSYRLSHGTARTPRQQRHNQSVGYSNCRTLHTYTQCQPKPAGAPLLWGQSRKPSWCPPAPRPDSLRAHSRLQWRQRVKSGFSQKVAYTRTYLWPWTCSKTQPFAVRFLIESLYEKDRV